MVIKGKHYTSLQEIYDMFLSLITDDMYLEWDSEQSYDDINLIFLTALPNFEFPKFDLYAFVKKGEVIDEASQLVAEEDMYPFELSLEEQRIIALLMLIEWLNRQIATIDVIRQNYMTKGSQANHLDKLIKLLKHYERRSAHYQNLYSRRNLINNTYQPDYSWTGGKKNAN